MIAPLYRILLFCCLSLTAWVFGCSRSADSTASGSDDRRQFVVPKLTDSEPYRRPKYPPHTVVQPSVPPSAFSSGPPYDWEHPVPKPEHTSTYRLLESFTNTRTLDETTAWIKKAMDAYVPSNRPPNESTRFLDFHFRGCLFEWHEEWSAGEDHVNESNYSVSLADADLTQIVPSSHSFRLGWDAQKNPVLFRTWQKQEGHWQSLGERLQRISSSTDFPVSQDNMAEPLAFAFVHAARLCGAKFPERR